MQQAIDLFYYYYLFYLFACLFAHLLNDLLNYYLQQISEMIPKKSVKDLSRWSNLIICHIQKHVTDIEIIVTSRNKAKKKNLNEKKDIKKNTHTLYI